MDSNETLYGGDPKFLSELNKLCETLIGQILDHLKTLGRDEVRRDARKRCFCCYARFSQLHFDIVLLAEHAASRRSSLLTLWCDAGSRRPEEQQAEPAGCQPVEPQPQARILRHSRLSECVLRWQPHGFSHRTATSTFCCTVSLRFGLWRTSSIRLSSPTRLTCPTWCRGSCFSLAPEHQPPLCAQRV